VGEITQERVLLKDTQGTLWQGSAQWVLSASDHRAASQIALNSRLNWRIYPELQGWRPGLKMAFQSDCCIPQAQTVFASVGLTGAKVSVAQFDSQWPASWLSGLGAPWNTLQLQGQIQMKVDQLTWSSARAQTFEGHVLLKLQELSTQLSTLAPLGSYALHIKGGETPQLELSTIDGALQLSGRGQWVGQRLRFQGEASARDDSEAALSNLLNVLGQRRGKSSVLNMS
jgi:general secretion pathway protein N